MSGTLLLLGGLGAVSGGVALGARAVTGRASQRKVIDTRLDAIEQNYGPGVAKAQPQAESFTDRVLMPSLGRLGGLGHRLTPDGLVGKLHRSLALAGNPPLWPVERIMQVKGLGLL